MSGSQEGPQLPPMPSAATRRRTRIVSAALALTWLSSVVLWLAFNMPEFSSIALSPALLVLAMRLRFVSDETEARAWWVLKAAWLGERAKPPAVLRQRVERHERAERERREAEALAPWGTGEPVATAAPRPALVEPAADAPTEVRLTVAETDALAGLTGGGTGFLWAQLHPAGPLSTDAFIKFAAERDARRAASAAGLVQRGILRLGPGGLELAPQWRPLIGVALLPSRSVGISWSVGKTTEQRRALLAPGHTVEQSCSADRVPLESDEAEAQMRADMLRNPAGFEHKLWRSSAAAVADAVIAGLPALDTPLPSGEPNWMLVAVHHGDNLVTKDNWVVKRDGAGYSVGLLGAEPEPDRRALPIAGFRDWLLTVLSV